MSPAYAVGDIVRILPPPGEDSPMVIRIHGGSEGKIVSVTNGDTYPFLVELKNKTRLGFKAREMELVLSAASDSVNHPNHYTWLPNGIEVIDITALFNFSLGNALKYILRAGRKGEALEDLKKARWYLDYEIKQRENA